MDDVANYADYVYVLEKGRIVNSGQPHAVFQNLSWLKEKQLGVPTATEFAEKLNSRTALFSELPITADELADQLVALVGDNLMMNKLIFGRYMPGDSLIHRLDPRAKLLASFYFIGIIFLANNWQTYALLAVFTLLAVFLSKVDFKFFIRGIRPLIWLILFTVALQVLFTSGGATYWSWGIFNITEFGVMNGLFIFADLY